MRGRATPAADHSLQKLCLLEARAEEAERRRVACAELIAVGPRLAVARLSAPAMAVLLELLAGATSTGRATLPDHPLTLWVAPSDGALVVHSEMGNLTVYRQALSFAPAVAEEGLG
jgi:hypothetical protein